MEPDLLVSCPYNPAHRIRKYKFMSHVAKCKKTAKTENKVECPLDKSHIVDRDQLRKHIETCPSLGSLINVDTGHITQEKDMIIDTYRSSENWEEEPEVPSYNPMEASASKQVIRCVPGLSKSEKKKFRDSERMRIANLKGAFNTARTTSLTRDDTVQELPVRPPCSTSATLYDGETTQDDFDGSQLNDNFHTNTQPKSTNGFQNLFYNNLYDRLAPECNDTNQQLEYSLYSNDMGACSLDYSQHTDEEKINLSFFNQNHEGKRKGIKKSQLNETFEISNISNLNKEKDETIIENTSRASERMITGKMLVLLKSNSDVKKVDSIKDIKKINENEDSDERGLKCNDVFKKFNDRLAYLKDIQNAVAQESAELLKQLKELKLREESH